MIEVDYVWVGEESKTGDAIACRFTRPDTGGTAVIVIDGGFQETGQRLVELIRRYYETNEVDLVVCTHPDNDHLQGLFTVLEEMVVHRLLIHQPSAYGYGPGDDVKADLVDNLVATARANGTAVDGGFTGTRYFGGALTVVGPTSDFYTSLLFEQGRWDSPLSKLTRAVSESAKALGRATRTVLGDPGETMTDDNGGTSPRNNSSIILNLQVDGYRALFSGDAGVPALQAAADYMDATGLSGSDLDFFHVPHHGSRHNLNPAILDRLLGVTVDDFQLGSAFVSVGKKADDHPRPEVANAIRRRGYPVLDTRGKNICWTRDAPTRWDYGPAQPLGWLQEGD